MGLRLPYRSPGLPPLPRPQGRHTGESGEMPTDPQVTGIWWGTTEAVARGACRGRRPGGAVGTASCALGCGGSGTVPEVRYAGRAATDQPPGRSGR
jgi:hypothetical protein